LSGRLTTIRDNIVAAITALPGYNGTPVFKLGIPHDLFWLGPRVAIGVCLSEEDYLHPDEGLGDRLDREAEMLIPICVLSTSEANVAAALEEDVTGIDDLSALILGSHHGPMAGPGLRSANVGVVGETGGVYLRAIKTTLIPDPKRSEGSGGALMKVILMRTTAVPL
jgi:hypothetical protein